MSTRRIVPLDQFGLACGYGPSSYVSPQGIYLVSGESESRMACAIYKLGKVIIGDKVYVRIPEEYGRPLFQVFSRKADKRLSGDPSTAPVHVDGDLWVTTVTEADDDGWIYLYSFYESPPKMYTAVGFNVKPLSFLAKAAIGSLPPIIVGLGVVRFGKKG